MRGHGAILWDEDGSGGQRREAGSGDDASGRGRGGGR